MFKHLKTMLTFVALGAITKVVLENKKDVLKLKTKLSSVQVELGEVKVRQFK